MKTLAPESDTARLRAVCCGLAVVTLLVYLPVWHHGFVLFDDDEYVTGNRTVQAGVTWAAVKWAFTTWHAGNWHPLTWLSLMLDCELFGLNAGAHHLVSVLIHCANSVLVVLVWRRMTGALWPGALAGALFAWHPLRVESVAWAAERKDVLSALFFLLTLWAYAAYAESKVSNLKSKVGNTERRTSNVQRRTSNVELAPSVGSGFEVGCSMFDVRASESVGRGRWIWYLAALLLFACGLMSKPMLVTTPFVLLLLDYWPLQQVASVGSRVTGGVESKVQSPKSKVEDSNTPILHHSNTPVFRLVWEKVPFFALSAASCIVTFLSQRATAVATLREYSLDLRLGNAVIAYAWYLLKMIWPAELAVIYPPPDKLLGWELALAAGLLAVISALVWTGRRRCPYLLAGWLWFLGTLVPVIGLVQVGGQGMADRYTYIPLLGIFVALAFGARDLAARFRFGPGAVAIAASLVLLSLLLATRQQLRYWKNSESLFAHAVAVTKDNSLAEVNLGAAFEQEGRKREALVHYREGLRIAEAHPHVADTVATPAQKAVAYANLGGAFEQAGYGEEAAALYRQAVSFDPARADLHEHLGEMLVNLGQFDEAMRELAEAARLKPSDPRPFYVMGAASYRRGQIAEAIAHFRSALRLKADDVDTLTFLARILAWDGNPQIRNGVEAVALAERANVLSGGLQPLVLDTLAIAYAETSRFSEAEQLTRKAIELATAGEAKDLVPAMRKRLLRYEAGQPYREGLTNSLPGDARP